VAIGESKRCASPRWLGSGRIIRGLTITEKITEIGDCQKAGPPTAQVQQFTRAVRGRRRQAETATGILTKLGDIFTTEKAHAINGYFNDTKEGLEGAARALTAMPRRWAS
jgi:hypothetical protein